ncbi:MAG: FAD-dependent monooxygenase, partial [Microbacterium sp.]|nr:FAD-dependent monooxygenase [Microbacterium sp.]
ELVRTDLEAPRVGGDPGDLGAVQPSGRRQRETRCRTAGVVAPPLAPRARVTGLDARADDAVEVFVNDESVGVYDLLIGADGLNSTVRELIGIDTRPEPTGMGIWRAFVSRPAEVERSELYYGGPVYIAGYTPTGEDTMYAYLVEDAQDRTGVSDDEAVQIMLGESMAYGGPWEAIRADLAAGASVNYTWFTQHIVPAPWNRGRVVVIGDAAHSCPPTIAQGAAQALEDALVLTELLTARDAVDQDLWDAFHARRVPRAQAVVEASVQLGAWQLEHNRDADAPGLIFGIAHRMAEPA